MSKWFTTIVLVISFYHLRAQGEIKDSSLFITSVRLSYAAQLPGGNLAERFGWNSNLGIHVDVKTKKSILFGLEGTFLFGNTVKEDVLANLKTEDGEIIDQNGTYAIVPVYERGHILHAYVGYIIPKLGPNPNSGIMLKAGLGFMQHKIRIEHNKNPVPALNGEYLKGYDRLTNGLSLNEFVGYQFLSNSRLWNFFAGFEFTQGFTQSRRDWNTDEMRKDDTKRMDLLYGFRVGWILPLYQRAAKAYYYGN